MRRCAIAILLLARSATAQPDAHELLKQVAGAYAAVRGYELLATVTHSGFGSTSVAAAYLAPDRLMLQDKRTKIVTSYDATGYQVFNGIGTVPMSYPEPQSPTPQTIPLRGGAMPVPPDPPRDMAAETRSQALVRIGLADYTAIAARVESARVIGEEEIKLDDEAIRCTVVEAHYPRKEMRTFWIDSRGVVLKEVSAARSVEIVKMQWGAPPAESLFDLTALNVRRTGFVRPQPVDPVGQMKCDPFTPEAVMAHLSGQITIQFTVDTQGHPSDMQVRNPIGLGVDQLAMECLSVAQYRPAMRDGVPVSATTTWTNLRQPDITSDWRLAHIKFQIPAGTRRPIFIKAPYPPMSRAEGNAAFHVSLTVDRSGTPRNVRVTSSDAPQYDGKAVALVSGWRFKPAQADGSAVEAPVELTLVRGHYFRYGPPRKK